MARGVEPLSQTVTDAYLLALGATERAAPPTVDNLIFLLQAHQDRITCKRMTYTAYAR